MLFTSQAFLPPFLHTVSDQTKAGWTGANWVSLVPRPLYQTLVVLGEGGGGEGGRGGMKGGGFQEQVMDGH